ncbi:GNAT family N-acetyltransferase [Aquincola sp. MAHUQ-54]|uniref:GNAT family N-acetyltransferase n=1 Tax=Aquincola agrisoli TaxID=3119538 RepID=A0AAW9QGV6_9BURK
MTSLQPDVTLRWVTEFDAATSASVVALVDCAAAGDRGTLGYASSMTAGQAQDFIAGLQRRVAAGDAHALYGQVGGMPAMSGVMALTAMPNCRHRAELSKGVIRPEFRGLRYLQMGLREMVRRAERLGVEQFVLDVREGSRAQALWKRLGFRTYGILDDYARVGGVRYNGHFMVQEVASLRARLMAGDATPVRRQGCLHA